MEAVSEMLRMDGFSETLNDVELQGKHFYIDRHCPDVFCFSSEQRQFFEEHPLIQDGHLVIQVYQKSFLSFLKVLNFSKENF